MAAAAAAVVEVAGRCHRRWRRVRGAGRRDDRRRGPLGVGLHARREIEEQEFQRLLLRRQRLAPAAVREREIKAGDIRLVARGGRRRIEVDGGEDRAPTLRVGRCLNRRVERHVLDCRTLRLNQVEGVLVDGDPALGRPEDPCRGVLRLVDRHLAADWWMLLG